MAVIRSSDLDFDTIKNNLKTFFQSKSEFTDYDFEASGLSNILDVLAYNTHINGLTANFAINESFLNSAQLRSSVVAHAETVGYYPASKTGAFATIDFKVETSDTVTASANLPALTQFTGTIGDDTFTFQTLEAHSAVNDGAGTFQFKTEEGSSAVVITEGTQRTKTFLVGDTTDNQIYVVPDVNLDKNTVKVEVFDTSTSSTFNAYSDIETVVRIDANSRVFIIRETPNGFFELIFGEDSVLGKAPVAGNKIVVTYLSTNGADANSITTFTANDQLSIGGVSYTPTVTTTVNSAGGGDKESIESIKLNAPITFASQQRLVTAEDYKAIISQRFTTLLDDVAAWGGEDNIPATFGDVYLSLSFKDGISAAVQTDTKNTIQNVISPNLGIMSIDAEFVDPITTFIELSITFDFDPDLTGLTLDATQSNVKTEAASFFSTNLGKFNSVFRKSQLITVVDALSPAILNSSMTTKVQQRLAVNSVTPADGLQLNVQRDYTINFPVALASPDDVNYIVTSTNFTSNGKSVFLRNLLESTKLQLISADDGTVVVDNVGSYNTSSGVVTISGQSITAIQGESIKITATPADQGTIKPLRNYILKYDTVRSRASGTFDFQNTAVTIS